MLRILLSFLREGYGKRMADTVCIFQWDVGCLGEGEFDKEFTGYTSLASLNIASESLILLRMADVWRTQSKGGTLLGIF